MERENYQTSLDTIGGVRCEITTVFDTAAERHIVCIERTDTWAMVGEGVDESRVVAVIRAYVMAEERLVGGPPIGAASSAA